MDWISLDHRSIDRFSDRNTLSFLLPEHLTRSDNARRMRFCRLALKKAMQTCLTDLQRESIELYYFKGATTIQIADLQNRSQSSVSKTISRAKAQLRNYIQLYMGIYDELERQLLREAMEGDIYVV